MMARKRKPVAEPWVHTGLWSRLGRLPGRLAAAGSGLRLQTKLALFGAALVLTTGGLTGAAGWWLIDRQTERTARERLSAASDFAVAEYEALTENARIAGEVLAARLAPSLSHDLAHASVGLESGLTPELAASLTSLVRGPRRVEAADSIAVIARDGTVLLEVVRDGGPSRGGQWPGDDAVTAALGGETSVGVEVFPGGGLRAVAVLPLGTAGVGAAGTTPPNETPAAALAVTSFLDDDAAEWLSRVTGFQVAFFAGERAVAASRRPPAAPHGADRGALQEQLARVWPRVAGGDPAEAEIGGPLQRTLVRYAPLRGTGGDVIGAVAVSAGIEVLGVGRRQTLALFAAALGVVLALALASGAYASRVLSRPLANLVAAVRRIGAGDLATPVTEGEPPAAATNGRDEVAELATAVEDMRRRLAAAADSQKQLARLKDEYLFSVAHELRSPLAALAGSVELLAEPRDELPTEERARFTGIVQRHTAALRSLVDNLLDLGSLRAGRFRIEPCPTPAVVVVEEAIEDVAPFLDVRRLTVVRRVPTPSPVAWADPRRLRQVLVNLLSNAAKYGPADSVVEIVVEQRRGAVRFSVADRGPGLRSEEQARLFDPYFRSDATSRAAPGVGLGLAIVKAIADAHGGRAGVESAPGAGARFWVEVPAASGEPPEAALSGAWKPSDVANGRAVADRAIGANPRRTPSGPGGAH
jgi:signal transduction histidine kinase